MEAYRLFDKVSAGRHTTGSASTRRSLAARPDGMFAGRTVTAPGEVMEIDSTPLDVMVLLDGQPRTGTTDAFGPFDAYATRRLRQDPHLSAAALHRELLGLGYTGSYSAFTRSLRQRGLLSECPDCSNDTVPRITQRASLLNHPHRPHGLPIRVAPILGQTLASFLDQVAVANHLPAAALLAHLPVWFRHQYRTHDDLGPGRARVHRQDADALAALTRTDADVLTRTLPALAGRHRDQATPMRLTVACHRCTARRGLSAEIPVHLPALQRLCPRHRIWLGHTQQIDTTGCPDILPAARRAARLARSHGATRVLLAETIAHQTIQQHLTQDQYPDVTKRWTTRIDRLATARTRSPSGTEPHAREDLIAAATYSDTITLAARLLSRPARRPGRPQKPSTRTRPWDHFNWQPWVRDTVRQERPQPDLEGKLRPHHGHPQEPRHRRPPARRIHRNQGQHRSHRPGPPQGHTHPRLTVAE
ncbi:MAG TPA: hypothetical protein VI248_04260 [Kineosporiaceae bacterium]